LILRKMDVLTEEIANANHIMHDYVYQVMCGIPSGCAITTILNSLCNCIYIRYVYMKIFPKANERDFKRTVFLKVYGDDLIMSVHPDIIEQFNCQTISLVLKEYDITFTDADKTGTEQMTTIDKATFLKSGFLEHPTLPYQWLSPLATSSVHECAQWVWKSNDLTRATLENVEQSVRLAYGHGPEYFNVWRKCLNKALTSKRLPNISITWDRINSQFFPEEFFKGVLVPCEFPPGLRPVELSSANSLLKEGDRAEERKSNVVKFLLADDMILPNGDENETL
jgi:hypothetical protein